MKNLTPLLVISLIIGLSCPKVEAISCAYGRWACISSCQSQNCATGYCSPESGPAEQQICVCSRCGQGSNWPI